MNILFLDDHQIILSGFENIFKTDERYKVFVAQNTSEARVYLTNQQINLLVSDISLKGESIDGLDFCDEIKLKYPSLKILIYTQLTFYDILQQIKESGFDGVVFKDDKNEELLNAIEEILKGNKYYSPLVKEILLENYLGTTKNSKYTEIVLTDREELILQKVVEGKKDKEIASELLVSVRTIESNVSNLILKFKVRNRVELVTSALKKGKAKLT